MKKLVIDVLIDHHTRKFKEKSAISLMASKDFSYLMITGCLLIGQHCIPVIFIIIVNFDDSLSQDLV